MNSLSGIDDPKIRIKFGYGNLLKIDKAYKKSTGLHIFEPAYMYCILMKYRYIYIIVICQVQIPVLSLSHS